MLLSGPSHSQTDQMLTKYDQHDSLYVGKILESIFVMLKHNETIIREKYVSVFFVNTINTIYIDIHKSI